MTDRRSLGGGKGKSSFFRLQNDGSPHCKLLRLGNYDGNLCPESHQKIDSTLNYWAIPHNTKLYKVSSTNQSQHALFYHLAWPCAVPSTSRS